MPGLFYPLRTFRLMLSLAAGLALAACSAAQIGDALANLCHGAEACTAYNSDGSPVVGRWYASY